MQVFVLSKDKKPLMPTSPQRARELLKSRQAVIHKYQPFTIRLKDRYSRDSHVQPVILKLDPGSKTTGIALVSPQNDETDHVLHLAHLEHRGAKVRDNLLQRSQRRRRRRSANLRYRQPRFNNRRRADGWLAPSLRSRVDNVLSWVAKYRRLVPVSGLAVEVVRFDTQLMDNTDIQGVEYQQGTLWGYEVREYLLETWGRKCAYCGKSDVPLEIEHVIPKSRGGSNRIDNLTLACTDCNLAKGNQTATEFGHPEIQKAVKKSRRDTAAVNSTRKALWFALYNLRLPCEYGTGGMTKFNRIRLGLPKDHCLDAVSVGKSTAPHVLFPYGTQVLVIKAKGRGKYQRTQSDAYGFPKVFYSRSKTVIGIKTGDIAKIKLDGRIIRGRVTKKSPKTLGIMLNGKMRERTGSQFAVIQFDSGYDFGVVNPLLTDRTATLPYP